jgi:hypothetical protein
MSQYDVVWLESAQDELAELWLQANDRNALTSAAHLIDVELSHDAEVKGRELSEGLRALLAPPLRVLFSVDEEKLVVEVASVRRLK